jgi:glycerol dehydrogenase-like iron-containing ADH family enzyme
LATKKNKEKKWPWDDEIAQSADNLLQNARKNIREINKMTDDAIKLIMEVHRWCGSLWPNSGWNNRWGEGCEHFFFYNLEYLTKKHFIHGEPVCLGIILVTACTGYDHEAITKDILDVGVKVRPEEMGVTAEDVIEAFASCKDYCEKNGLFYTAINEIKVDRSFIKKILKEL